MPDLLNLTRAESQMTLASSPSVSYEEQPGWLDRRTRMERYLILTATTMVLAVVALSISLATGIIRQNEALTAHGQQGICLTKNCVKAAANLIESMDETVDPCEDFYEFACGGFLKKTIIPDDTTAITRFAEMTNALQLKLCDLVEAEETPTEPRFSKMVKNLFKSCMDTDTIQKKGLDPLKDVLRQMGGWPVLEGAAWDPSGFQWTQNIYINRQLGFPLNYLFSFAISTDIVNSTWRIIAIDQPKLGMPSRKYLLKGFNDSDVQAYYNYQINMAVLLGADRTTAERELKESLEFEIQIANNSIPKEQRRNIWKLSKAMTIGGLQTMVPEIPWLEYINRVLHPFVNVTTERVVVVEVPDYVKNLGKLLKNTPKRVIANYMLWRVTADSVSYLSEDARNIELEYYTKLVGQGTRGPRWEECMATISSHLPSAVGSMYVRKFFKEDAKLAADTMVHIIRGEFEKILETLDWMDPLTREKALSKAWAITPYVAYPPELLDDLKLAELYDGLVISSGDLLENMRNLTIFGTDHYFKRLRDKVDKKDWKNHGNAAIVNAYYNSIENSITIPAGILQGTFFEADHPKYMNFGGIGYFIGHEITHGFDDTGRQFDDNGDLRDWWEMETKQKFLQKTQCIIHQYGNYSVPEVGLNLNGIYTQGENIADNGGIKIAYYAYIQWTKEFGEEERLPSLPYTSKQLFWISAANVWCSKYRPEALKLRILTDAHTPARFRVNGPFSNRPEFAVDWKCPAGSKLNPAERCSVW